MRIYISGAITNNKDFKKDFENAEVELKKKFLKASIINPSKLKDVFPGGTYEEYMDICLNLLKKCEYIHQINGWEDSQGACIEYGYALAKNISVI